jgi:hypothetical protein
MDNPEKLTKTESAINVASFSGLSIFDC